MNIRRFGFAILGVVTVIASIALMRVLSQSDHTSLGIMLTLLHFVGAIMAGCAVVNGVGLPKPRQEGIELGQTVIPLEEAGRPGLRGFLIGFASATVTVMLIVVAIRQ